MVPVGGPVISAVGGSVGRSGGIAAGAVVRLVFVLLCCCCPIGGPVACPVGGSAGRGTVIRLVFLLRCSGSPIGAPVTSPWSMVNWWSGWAIRLVSGVCSWW